MVRHQCHDIIAIDRKERVFTRGDVKNITERNQTCFSLT